MGNFKLISKETDFENLKMYMIGWDAFCKGTNLDVYQIDGYMHTQGGKWGENCYWACPRGEKPTYENLHQFNGEPCSWGFRVESSNYYKSKYGDQEIRHSYVMKIIRNDWVFYTFGAHNLDWGISRIRQLLFQISEHAIEFHAKDFEKSIVGRKIYWKEQPAVITSYSRDGNLVIAPAGKKSFDLPCYNDDEVSEEIQAELEDIVEDLFAPSIYWFRHKLMEGEV